MGLPPSNGAVGELGAPAFPEPAMEDSAGVEALIRLLKGGEIEAAATAFSQALKRPNFFINKRTLKLIVKSFLSPLTPGVRAVPEDRLRLLISKGVLHLEADGSREVREHLLYYLLLRSCDEGVFATWTDFGGEFRDLVIQTMIEVEPYHANQVLREVLNRIEDAHKAAAYNAVIECTGHRRVPPSYGFFGEELLRQMLTVEPKLKPSAEACDGVLTYLSTLTRCGLRSSHFQRLVELYNLVRQVMPHLSRETFGSLFKTYNLFPEHTKRTMAPLIGVFSDLSPSYAPCLRVCTLIVEGCEDLVRRSAPPNPSAEADPRPTLEQRIEALLRNRAMFEEVAEDDLIATLVSCYARMSEGDFKLRSAAVGRLVLVLGELGVALNAKHFGAVLAAYGVIGDLDAMYRTFAALPTYGVQPDARCFSEVLYAYALNCDFRQVVSIVQSAIGERPVPELASIHQVPPNHVLLAHIIAAAGQLQDLDMIMRYWDMCLEASAASGEPIRAECYKAATKALRTFIVAASKTSRITATEASLALAKVNEVVTHLDKHSCVGPKSKAYNNAVKAHANYLMLEPAKRDPHFTWQEMLEAYTRYFFHHRRPTNPSIYSTILDALTELVRQDPHAYPTLAPEAKALIRHVRSLGLEDMFVFASLFKFAGSGGDQPFLKEIFAQFLGYCNNVAIVNPAPLVKVFNLYLQLSDLELESIPYILDTMVRSEAHSDYLTYTTLFGKLPGRPGALAAARLLFARLLRSCSTLDAALRRAEASPRTRYAVDRVHEKLRLFKSIATCFLKLGDASFALDAVRELELNGVSLERPASIRAELYEFLIFHLLTTPAYVASKDASPILKRCLERLTASTDEAAVARALLTVRETLDAAEIDPHVKAELQHALNHDSKYSKLAPHFDGRSGSREARPDQ
ncbi:hypothetical protein L0F63_005279 [Massospora cicadina]|nr:hypothetical protein L0F63_005279 [Massospora cicadina]